MSKLAVGDVVRRKQQFMSEAWVGVCRRRGLTADAELILEKVDGILCRVSGMDMVLASDRFELAKGNFKDE